MEESLEHRIEMVFNDNIKNIELISYFKRSTKRTSVFLGDINRKYAEIRSLIDNGLIIDKKAVKTYIFYLDKFENYFYEKYQEKIDFLKVEIWRRKRKKNELIELTENITPEEGCEDYEEKLRACIEFAKQSIGELDTMEIEKEDYNNVVGELQEKQQNDPLHDFLLYIRNDKEIIFNKRTEDNEGIIHKKILNYLNKCTNGKGWQFFTELKKKGFYKEFSPAKSYYISELGLMIDEELKKMNWNKDLDFEKTEMEKVQEDEFNKLKDLIGL
ncbi:MAG: hypothetical protein ACFE94_02420 [Candidatus Hodarchaeota archaeon]